MVNSSSNSNETLKTRVTPKSELKSIKGNSESRSNSSSSSSSSTSSPRNLKKSLSSTSLNPSQSGIPVISTPKSQIARHHERIGGAKGGSISPSGIPRAQQISTPTSSSSTTNSNNRSINKQNESKSNGNHHQLQSQSQFQSKPSATPSPSTNSIQLPKSNTASIASPSSLPLYSRPPISPSGQPQSLSSSSFNFSANSSSSSNLAYQSPSRLPIASNLPSSSTDYSKLNTPKSSQFKPRVSTDTTSTPAKNIEYGFSGGNEQRQLFAGGSNVSNGTITPTAPAGRSGSATPTSNGLRKVSSNPSQAKQEPDGSRLRMPVSPLYSNRASPAGRSASDSNSPYAALYQNQVNEAIPQRRIFSEGSSAGATSSEIRPGISAALSGERGRIPLPSKFSNPSLLKPAFVAHQSKDSSQTPSALPQSQPRPSVESTRSLEEPNQITSPYLARQSARQRAVFEAVALAPPSLSSNSDLPMNGGRKSSTELSRSRDWSSKLSGNTPIEPTPPAAIATSRVSKEDSDGRSSSSSMLGKEFNLIPLSSSKKSKTGRTGSHGEKGATGKIAARFKAALSSPQKTFSSLSNSGGNQNQRSNQSEKEGLDAFKNSISSPIIDSCVLTKSSSADSPSRSGRNSLSQDGSFSSPRQSLSSNMTSSAKSIPRKIARRISSGGNFVPSILRNSLGSSSTTDLTNDPDEPEWDKVELEVFDRGLEQEILNSSPPDRKQAWRSMEANRQVGSEPGTNLHHHHRNRSSTSEAEDSSYFKSRPLNHGRSESASAIPSTTVSSINLGISRSKIVPVPLALGPPPVSFFYGSRKAPAYEPSHSPIPESISSSTLYSSGLPSAGLGISDGDHLSVERAWARKPGGFSALGLGYGSFGREIEPPSPIMRARLEEQQSTSIQQELSKSQSEPQLSHRPTFRHTASLDSGLPTVTRNWSLGSMGRSQLRPGMYQSPSLDGVVVAVPTLRGSSCNPSKMSLSELRSPLPQAQIQPQPLAKTRNERAPTLESLNGSILSSDSFETRRSSCDYLPPSGSSSDFNSLRAAANTDRAFRSGHSVVSRATKTTLRHISSVPDLASIRRESRSGMSSSKTLEGGMNHQTDSNQSLSQISNARGLGPTQSNSIKSVISALSGSGQFSSPAFKTESYVKAVHEVEQALLPSSITINRWRSENERELDLGTPSTMTSCLSSSPESVMDPSPSNLLFGLPDPIASDGSVSLVRDFRSIRPSLSSPDLARRHAIHETRDRLLKNEKSNQESELGKSFSNESMASRDHSPLTLRMKTLAPGVEIDSFQLSPDNSLGLLGGTEIKTPSLSTGDVFGSSSPPQSGRTSRSSGSTAPSFRRAIGGFTSCDQGSKLSESLPQPARRESSDSQASFSLMDIDVEKEIKDYNATHPGVISSPEGLSNWLQETRATKFSPNQKSPSFSERRANKSRPKPLQSPSPRGLRTGSESESPGTARPRLPIASPKKYAFEIANTSTISSALNRSDPHMGKRQDTSRSSMASSSRPWPEVYEVSSVEGSENGDVSDTDDRFSISEVAANPSRTTWSFMSDIYNNEDPDQSQEEAADTSRNDSSTSGGSASTETARWAPLLRGKESQSASTSENFKSNPSSSAEDLSALRTSVPDKSLEEAGEVVVDELDLDVELRMDEGDCWTILIRDPPTNGGPKHSGRLRKVVKGSTSNRPAPFLSSTPQSNIARATRSSPRINGSTYRGLPHSASSALETLGALGAVNMSELEMKRMEASLQAQREAGLLYFSPHSRTASNPVVPHAKNLKGLTISPNSARNRYLNTGNNSLSKSQGSENNGPTPPRSPGFYPKPLRILEEGSTSREDINGSRSKSSLDLEREHCSTKSPSIPSASSRLVSSSSPNVRSNGLVAAAHIGPWKEHQRSTTADRRAGLPSPGGTLGYVSRRHSRMGRIGIDGATFQLMSPSPTPTAWNSATTPRSNAQQRSAEAHLMDSSISKYLYANSSGQDLSSQDITPRNTRPKIPGFDQSVEASSPPVQLLSTSTSLAEITGSGS